MLLHCEQRNLSSCCSIVSSSSQCGIQRRGVVRSLCHCVTTSIWLSSVTERFFHRYTPIAMPAAVIITTPNPPHNSAIFAHLGKEGDGEVGEEHGSHTPLPVMSSHQVGSGHVCEHVCVREVGLQRLAFGTTLRAYLTYEQVIPQVQGIDRRFGLQKAGQWTFQVIVRQVSVLQQHAH